MATAGDREARESSIASGWTVQADPRTLHDESGHDGPAHDESARARREVSLDGRESQSVGAEPLEAQRADGADGDAVAGSAAAEAADDAASDGEITRSAQLSNGALVLLGVFGGLYLLYAWIWLSWAQYYSGQNATVAGTSGSLGAALQQVVFWAAPLTPLLWFLTALLMNRNAGMRRLTTWIVIGAVVLVPLPVFGGGGAS